MRYTRVAHASWIIAVALAIIALAFATWRSRDVPGPIAPSPEAPAKWDGMSAAARIFDAECSSCHPSGEILRGHAVDLYKSTGGREYLVRFMIDGRIRTISEGVESYTPGHPSFAQMSNQDIADTLNYMLRSWGNDGLLGDDEPLYVGPEVGSLR